MKSLYPWILFVLSLPALIVACSANDAPALYVGGIPDQNVAFLEERFDGLADYLSDELDLDVQYIPTTSYAAVVTGFSNGDIHLGWYGGLTGVQARLATPGAQAIAQRPRDAEFHSVFVANPALGLKGLGGVAGMTLTFGSESSTSGHLMPRSFLSEAGVVPERDLDGPPSYSGSHDKTWKLVEAGAFQVGALNAAVWESAVDEGKVDLSAVDVFWLTPPYVDYHFVVRGDVDETFGDGTTERLRAALLSIDVDDRNAGARERRIAESFQTERFIETTNENYQAIEDVAVELGIIKN